MLIATLCSEAAKLKNNDLMRKVIVCQSCCVIIEKKLYELRNLLHQLFAFGNMSIFALGNINNANNAIYCRHHL